MSLPETMRASMKRLIVASLNLEGVSPEAISDDEPLFGGPLGLDSVDALELVLAIEREYHLSIPSHEFDPGAFASVANLSDFVSRRLASRPGDPVHGD